MLKTEELKAALQRLVDESAGDQDREAIRRALLEGRIVMEAGERNVAVDSDSQTQIIVTGDHNQLHVELSDSLYSLLRGRIFPSPPGIAPPFPALIFVGREDTLGDIKELLGVNGATASRENSIIVRGWPGVGKTSLVGMLGRDSDIVKEFADGVLWTALDRRPDLLTILANWGQALGTDELLHAATLNDATAQLAALLLRRRMLLIVDDVWNEAHAAPFQKACGDQCTLLMTTRQTKVADALSARIRSVYNLPVLTEENALILLGILAPTVVAKHPDECRLLVRDIECLPLALHVAGRLLKREARMGWGVKDLIEEIRSGGRLIHEKAPADRAENGIIPTVAALLKRSSDMLDEYTRDCFAYLGVFAPKPATFDLNAMSSVWQTEDPKPVVYELVDHGLLEPVGDGRFQMHALLVQQARSLLS